MVCGETGRSKGWKWTVLRMDAPIWKECGIKYPLSPTEKSKVTVSESYPYRKLPFLAGRMLHFFNGESYRFFGKFQFWIFIKINGNFYMDKVATDWYKVTVAIKVTVFIGRKLPFVDKITVISKSYRFSAESNHFFITSPFLDKKFTTSWKQRTLWSSLV